MWSTHNLDQTEHVQMFCNDFWLNTMLLIDTSVGGLDNFTTTNGINKITEAIPANEHLVLYERYTSKLDGVIDLKLAIENIKLEDQIASKVERRLKAMNLGTLQVAQV